jgi:carbonic anhydrase
MAEGNFATAIACIDGRVQRPVFDWMRTYFQVAYVDMVTIPGPDLTLRSTPAWHLDTVRRSVEISVTAHASQAIGIAGHYDCAAHPVSREQHVADITATARQVVVLWELPVRVVGLWVNDRWQVELVWDSAASDALSRGS